MPIRPEMRDKYPADWHEISLAAKQRALWACEFCGVKHDSHVQRNSWRTARSALQPAIAPELESPNLILDDNAVRVVLTTAHLNHDPTDCHPDNLRALCQRCHLRYDAEHHAAGRSRRRRDAFARDQTSLLLEGVEDEGRI